MTYVTNTAIYFKHPAYKSEIEYRFLEAFSADASPSVCWRARRNALIRYREFDWRNAAPRALKEIIVGPADQGNARRFANECLCWHPDAENVAIIPSLIPYKAF